MLLFCAIFPILLALILMVAFKIAPGKALPCSLLSAAVIAHVSWKLEVSDILSYVLLGTMKAVDIILIIFCAILLLNILKKTGALEGIKSSFNKISPDRRVQAIVIAWFFSNFIEGVAGFGAATALAAPLLVGLGFPAIPAVVASLICNTLPVPFGGAGIPFTTTCASVAESVAEKGLDPAKFNHETLSYFTTISSISGAFIPFIAVTFMIMLSGGTRKFKSILEIFPLCFLGGVLYVLAWKGTAMFIGPELPSVLGSLVSFPIFYLVIKTGFLVPKHIWDFPAEIKTEAVAPQSVEQPLALPRWKSWLPYLCIAIFLVITRVSFLPFRGWMGKICKVHIAEIFSTPGSEYNWAILSNPGVFPFLPAAIVFALIFGLKWKDILQVFNESEKQVRFSAFAIISAFAMVQIMVSSSYNEAYLPGMLYLIAESVVRATGRYYILMAPVIGCFGTFFAGACTVSNILFCPIQFNAAGLLDFPETQMLALQNVGGGIGSMLRLSGIVATCATVNAAGKEGKIILLNLLPALILILLSLLGAYCYNLWLGC